MLKTKPCFKQNSWLFSAHSCGNCNCTCNFREDNFQKQKKNSLYHLVYSNNAAKYFPLHKYKENKNKLPFTW